jgi:hypothetical protein
MPWSDCDLMELSETIGKDWIFLAEVMNYHEKFVEELKKKKPNPGFSLLKDWLQKRNEVEFLRNMLSKIGHENAVNKLIQVEQTIVKECITEMDVLNCILKKQPFRLHPKLHTLNLFGM